MREGQKKTIRYTLYSAAGIGLIMLIFLSMYSFGFWYGKKLIIDNWDTQKYDIAVILSTFFCFLVGGSSVGQIAPFFKNIVDGRIAMAEFFDVLKREKTLVEPKEGVKLKSIKGLNLNNVSFSYKKDQPVLRNVTVKFP